MFSSKLIEMLKNKLKRLLLKLKASQRIKNVLMLKMEMKMKKQNLLPLSALDQVVQTKLRWESMLPLDVVSNIILRLES